MRIAAMQSATSSDLEHNVAQILRALSRACDSDARLLVTPECALCGYPPIEIDSISAIDFDAQNQAIDRLRAECNRRDAHLLVGMVRTVGGAHRNSMALLSPGYEPRYYDKRALWGWDQNNFAPGDDSSGVWDVEGIRIGVRICFEVRFPEFFRELYREHADAAIVAFADVGQRADPRRYSTLQAHLITRAVENTFHVVSANSTSGYQTAPTCAIGPNGDIRVEAKRQTDTIMYYDISKRNLTYGDEGRVHISNTLLGLR